MSTQPTTTPVTAISSAVSSLFTNSGKTLEKMALYVLGVLVSTNAITLPHVSPNTSLLSVAGILAALHISTPTPKSGPGQL